MDANADRKLITGRLKFSPQDACAERKCHLRPYQLMRKAFHRHSWRANKLIKLKNGSRRLTEGASRSDDRNGINFHGHFHAIFLMCLSPLRSEFLWYHLAFKFSCFRFFWTRRVERVASCRSSLSARHTRSIVSWGVGCCHLLDLGVNLGISLGSDPINKKNKKAHKKLWKGFDTNVSAQDP